MQSVITVTTNYYYYYHHHHHHHCRYGHHPLLSLLQLPLTLHRRHHLHNK